MKWVVLRDRMRVLLGNVSWRTPLRDAKERFLFGTGCRFSWSLIKRVDQRPRYAMLPLFLAYAAAMLERHDFEVQVLDGVPLNLTIDEFCGRATALEPDLLVFEPCTATFPITVEAATRLREATGARVILAGPHVSAMPLDVLTCYREVDYVLVGEYEQTLSFLARCLSEGRSDLDLPGIACRTRDGSPVSNGPSQNISSS